MYSDFIQYWHKHLLNIFTPLYFFKCIIAHYKACLILLLRMLHNVFASVIREKQNLHAEV